MVMKFEVKLLEQPSNGHGRFCTMETGT